MFIYATIYIIKCIAEKGIQKIRVPHMATFSGKLYLSKQAGKNPPFLQHISQVIEKLYKTTTKRNWLSSPPLPK
jgi:hypothetical protein